VIDDSFVLCFNAHHEPIEFAMPAEKFGARWLPVIDTANGDEEPTPVSAGEKVTIDARAMVVLQAHTDE
jgi:isoamylase